MKAQNVLLAFAFLLIVGTFVSATTIGIPNQFAVDSKKNIITLSDGLRVQPHANKEYVVIENTYPDAHKIKQSGELGHLWLNVITTTKTYPAKNEHWAWSITQNGNAYALVGTATDGSLQWTQTYSANQGSSTIKLTNTLKNIGVTPITISGVNLVVEGITNQNIPMTVTIGNSFLVDYSDIPRSKEFKYDGSSNGMGQDTVNGKSSTQTSILFSGNYTIQAGEELVIDPTISSIPYTISASGWYNLSGDLTGANGINVSAGTNDVILDCQNKKITGTNTTGSYGIIAYNNTNLTIENCLINAYQYGINASLQNNLTILNNSIYGYGGATGSTGGNGAAGWDAGEGYDCGVGGGGADGGLGANTYGVMITKSLYANVSNNLLYSLSGGTGGTGGNGGKGGSGAWPSHHIGCNGGAGGAGGIGGNLYALLLNDTNSSTIGYNTITASYSGTGGNGGTGGAGGNSVVGMGEANSGWGNWGGAGGAAGIAYITYYENSYSNAIMNNTYSGVSSRSGGSGGQGGGSGVCGCNGGCGYLCGVGGGGAGGHGGTLYDFYGLNSGNSTITYEIANQSTSGNGGGGGGSGTSVGWNCVGGGSNYCGVNNPGAGAQGNGGNITKFYFNNFDWGLILGANATASFALGTGALAGTYWGYKFEATSNNNLACEIGSNITDLDSNTLTTGACMLVTITAPTGLVVGSTSTGVFSFSSGIDTTANCTRWLDTNEVANGTISEGVTMYDNLSGLTTGAHTYNVTCLGLTSGERDDQTSPFSVEDWSLVNSSLVYSNNTYETMTTYFYSNISTSASITNTSAALWWDGFKINATEITTNYFIASVAPPLVSVNDTEKGFYWNYTLTYTNGSVIYATTATQKQYVDFAAWVSNYSADNYFLQEGAPSTSTIAITNLNPTTITISQMTSYLNYTNGTVIGSGNSTPVTIGTRANDYNTQENRTWDGFVIFTDGVNSRLVALPAFNITTYRIVIQNCTGGNIVVENMSVYDEETGLPINDDHIETAFTMAYTGRVYNFTYDLSGTYYKEICMWPNSSSFSASQEIWYSVPNVYAQRDYYLYANFTNDTKDVRLYLLNASRAYITTIYVTDENNNRQPNIIVSAQRYYLGENTYKAVAQLKTDFEGKGTTVLTPNTVYYQFVLMNASNGAILNTIPPNIIVCQSGTCPPYIVNLQIRAVKIVLVYSQMGRLSSICGLNNATAMFSCTIADSSGFTDASELIVKHKGAIDYDTTICDTSCVSSTCTLLCPLGNLSTTDSYWYGLYANMSDPETNMPLQQGFFGLGYNGMAWGIDGLIITLIVALTFFFAGAWRADVAMLLMVVGLLISYWMGFFTIADTTIGPLGSMPATAVFVFVGLFGIVVAFFWKQRNQA